MFRSQTPSIAVIAATFIDATFIAATFIDATFIAATVVDTTVIADSNPDLEVTIAKQVGLMDRATCTV
jgi:hypothetical protein